MNVPNKMCPWVSFVLMIIVILTEDEEFIELSGGLMPVVFRVFFLTFTMMLHAFMIVKLIHAFLLFC